MSALLAFLDKVGNGPNADGWFAFGVLVLAALVIAVCVVTIQTKEYLVARGGGQTVTIRLSTKERQRLIEDLREVITSTVKETIDALGPNRGIRL